VPLYDEEKSTYESKQTKSYDMFNRIMTKLFFEEGVSKNEDYRTFKEFTDDNEFIDWEDRQRTMRDAKSRQPSLTFDELAEKELYGRVLPKDSKIEQIKIESSKYNVSRENELIREHDLLTDTLEIMARDKFYDRQRERNNRLAEKALGIERKGPY
jgi:hypothetical protein